MDEISIEFEREGITTPKEVRREVLSKGAWTTIMFLYQDYDFKNECYGDSKVTIRRYQKKNGRYFQQSKFNISSPKQAGKIVDILKDFYEFN